METKFSPHLNFKDNARAAMEFYQTIFGGKLTLQTYQEFHVSMEPSEDAKIMHAELETGKGITMMAADTPNRMEYHPGMNFSLAISGDNEPELRAWFEALSSGGSVSMPLEKSMWGAIFGMCTDKFGVNWMVNIPS